MRHRRRLGMNLLIAIVATLLFPAAPAAAAEDPVIVAAGDIGDCATTGDEATAVLLDGIPGTVAALGDIAYPNGTAANFRDCYAPTWGRHRARTRPAVGNHEYKTTSAATPYFDYFGSSAGPRGKGWYSYDLGAWHVVVLNSNCAFVGGCGPSSAQVTWLKADLAANAGDHVLAYFHHPRYSSGNTATRARCRPCGRCCTPPEPNSCSTGTTTTTSASRRRIPGDAPTHRSGSGRSSSAPAARRCGRRPGTCRTARSSRQPMGCSSLTLRADGYDWAFVPIAGQDVHGRRHRDDPRPAAAAHPPRLHRDRRHVGRPGPFHPELRPRDDARHRRQHRQRPGRPRVRQGQGQRHDGGHRSGRPAPVGDQCEQGWADGHPDDDELDVERHDVEDPGAGDGSTGVRHGCCRCRRMGRARRDATGEANGNLRLPPPTDLERRARRVVEPGRPPAAPRRRHAPRSLTPGRRGAVCHPRSHGKGAFGPPIGAGRHASRGRVRRDGVPRQASAKGIWKGTLPWQPDFADSASSLQSWGSSSRLVPRTRSSRSRKAIAR